MIIDSIEKASRSTCGFWRRWGGKDSKKSTTKILEQGLGKSVCVQTHMNTHTRTFQFRLSVQQEGNSLSDLHGFVFLK